MQARTETIENLLLYRHALSLSITSYTVIYDVYHLYFKFYSSLFQNKLSLQWQRILRSVQLLVVEEMIRSKIQQSALIIIVLDVSEVINWIEIIDI